MYQSQTLGGRGVSLSHSGLCGAIWADVTHWGMRIHLEDHHAAVIQIWMNFSNDHTYCFSENVVYTSYLPWCSAYKSGRKNWKFLTSSTLWVNQPFACLSDITKLRITALTSTRTHIHIQCFVGAFPEACVSWRYCTLRILNLLMWFIQFNTDRQGNRTSIPQGLVDGIVH